MSTFTQKQKAPRGASVEIEHWIVRLFGGRLLGFQAGDANLFRYASNSPLIHTDPSGLEVPGANHFYPLVLGGSYQQPVFALSGAEHTAAHDVLREHGFARRVGFSWDDARDAWIKSSSVTKREVILKMMRAANIPQSMIDQHIDGILADSDPRINRSPGRPSHYRAGQVISADTIHQARMVAAQNAGRVAGNPARVGLGARPGMAPAGVARPIPAGQPRPGIRARAFGALTVFLTLKDAIQMAGAREPEAIVVNADYYFVADDGSVFVVSAPGRIGAAANFFAALHPCPPERRAVLYERVFIAGPRAGTSQEISAEIANDYRLEGEKAYGKLFEPPLGFLGIGQRTFKGGTERKTLPIVRQDDVEIGYIDEDGEHYHRNVLPLDRWQGEGA